MLEAQQLLESKVKDLPHIEWTNPPTTWLERTGGYAKSMDLRDYFAAKAMQAFLSKDSSFTCPDEIIAQDAYNAADAMLKARGA